MFLALLPVARKDTGVDYDVEQVRQKQKNERTNSPDESDWNAIGSLCIGLNVINFSSNFVGISVNKLAASFVLMMYKLLTVSC